MKLLSFIVPVKNEQDNVLILYNEITFEVKKINYSYEIFFIDDGSTDQTLKVLKSLHKKDKRIRIISLRGNFGKSVALSVGFTRTSGDIVFTIDGDLQDDPKEISAFLKKINEGFDLVSGWKQKRHDPLAKTIPSMLGNLLTRILTKVDIHDLNSGYKAYKKEVIKNLSLYGELYKFIPILVAKQNFKVGEIPIHHRERRFGKSKYGWERNIKGLLDLMTVVFLTGYLRRPGHFFGTLGLLSFFFGFLIGSFIAYLRITTGSIQERHPLLFLGMLLMIIGVQLISTGLLAEMMIYSKQKFDYTGTIKEII